MTRRKSIEGYDWIDISEIESVTERFPYLEFKYKDGETFLIDWTIWDGDRFIVSQSTER